MSNIQTINATVTSKPIDRGGYYTFDIETTEGKAFKATIDGIRLPDPSLLQEGTAYIMKGSNPKTGKGDRFSVWEFALPGSEEAKGENLQAYCESKLPELSTEHLGSSYFCWGTEMDEFERFCEEFPPDENKNPLYGRNRTAKAVAERLTASAITGRRHTIHEQGS